MKRRSALGVAMCIIAATVMLLASCSDSSNVPKTLNTPKWLNGTWEGSLII